MTKYVTPKVLLQGLATAEPDPGSESKDKEIDPDKMDDGKGDAVDTETVDRVKKTEKTEKVEKVEPTKMTATPWGRKTEAKVTNTQVGVCPVCQKQMKASQANNIAVLVCLDHNLVMPTQD